MNNTEQPSSGTPSAFDALIPERNFADTREAEKGSIFATRRAAAWFLGACAVSAACAGLLTWWVTK